MISSNRYFFEIKSVLTYVFSTTFENTKYITFQYKSDVHKNDY